MYSSTVKCNLRAATRSLFTMRSYCYSVSMYVMPTYLVDVRVRYRIIASIKYTFIIIGTSLGKPHMIGTMTNRMYLCMYVCMCVARRYIVRVFIMQAHSCFLY